MHLKITSEERPILKAEFNKQETIEQKYSFWKEKFNIKYAYYFAFVMSEINDFMIFPKNELETETLNKLIYSDYNSISVGRSTRKYQFSKEAFIKEISSTPNKDAFIEYELKRIDDYIFTRKQPSAHSHFDEENKNHFFIAGYESYHLRGIEMEWGKQVYEAPHLMQKIQGIKLAKYREFVKNYQKEEKKQLEIKLNGEQKFLILHYLGFGDELNTNTQKSKLYEFFIDELKFSSIQRLFPNIKDYETEKNINTIIDLFRLLKLDSKARELEDKLDKLRKKR